jgi:hypothetical protein
MIPPLRSAWLLVLVTLSCTALAAPPPVLPDRRLSPGDVLTTDASLVCRPGYAERERQVPGGVKHAVYRAYAITAHPPGEYEVDHLVSLERGGSNSTRKLWPQSYETQPLNAHVKDRVENRLHELVCQGRMTLRTAQRAITRDWTKAYRAYAGQLPAGARTQMAAARWGVLGRLSASALAAFVPEPGAAPRTDGGCPARAPVKISRSGIYHLPGDRFYARTHARACYRSGVPGPALLRCLCPCTGRVPARGGGGPPGAALPAPPAPRWSHRVLGASGAGGEGRPPNRGARVGPGR